MNLSLIILIVTLVASVSANIYLIVLLKRKKPRPESIELREFLADLMSGIGIVAVSRMDPNNILYRSPKQR